MSEEIKLMRPKKMTREINGVVALPGGQVRANMWEGGGGGGQGRRALGDHCSCCRYAQSTLIKLLSDG